MPGLNHVTGQRWEYEARITSSTTNRSRREFTVSESGRSAAPSRRAARNTSCAEFETIISPRGESIIYCFLARSQRAALLWTVFLLSAFFSRCRASPVVYRNRWSERFSRFSEFFLLGYVNCVRRRSRKDFDL